MIRAIRRRISLSTRDESGFGLAEFVVAIGLFAVLATIIVMTFSSFTTTLTRDRAATTNTNIATLGMDELTRMIRSATAIPQVSGVDLPAFVYCEQGEDRVLRVCRHQLDVTEAGQGAVRGGHRLESAISTFATSLRHGGRRTPSPAPRITGSSMR